MQRKLYFNGVRFYEKTSDFPDLDLNSAHHRLL